MLLLTAEEVAGSIYRAGWTEATQMFDMIRITFAESVKGEYVLRNGVLVRVEDQGTAYPHAGGFKCIDAHMIGTNPNGTTDRGGLQVNSIWTTLSDADAMDFDKNAKFAHDKIWAAREAKTKGSGMTAWAAFNNKTYQQYYAEAAEGMAAFLLHRLGRPYTGLARAVGGI